MAPATFLAGIVLALALGAALAGLWMRARVAARESRESALQPVADAVARLEGQIRDFELQRQHTLGGLEQHLTSLSRETVALSQALRAPGSRGRWGELTLRRVAELAGMVPYCDFVEQEAANGMRPDMLVKLPGGRLVRAGQDFAPSPDTYKVGDSLGIKNEKEGLSQPWLRVKPRNSTEPTF